MIYSGHHMSSNLACMELSTFLIEGLREKLEKQRYLTLMVTAGLRLIIVDSVSAYCAWRK